MDPPGDKEAHRQWEHWKKCLWGYVKDVIALPEVQAFGDEPGEFAVAAFKHALDNWQFTAAGIKFAAEATPGYKPRYWDYPNIPTIRRFHKAVACAYVMTLMTEKKIPPLKINLAAALLAATDPLAGHPGVAVPEEDPTTLESWPLKEPWKPITGKFTSE